MRPALILTFVLLAAAPAPAQELGMTIPDCRTLFKTTGFLKRAPDSTIETIDQGCRFSGTIIDFGPYTRFSVEDITLTGPDLMASLAQGQRPTSIDLAMKGMRLSPEMEHSPLTAYILEMQQEPYDIHLAMSWNDTDGILEIADASFSTHRLGRVALSGRLTGLTAVPLEVGNIEAFEGAEFESLTIDFDNSGLFTAYIAPMFVGTLPYDQDPRPAIAAGQQAIISTIAAMPEAQLSAETKAVLTQFVTDFPRPSGHYILDITALDEPVPFTSVEDFDGLDDLAGLLSRLNVTASFSDPEGLRSAK
ncbi:hypothetical protein [Devosia lacusdianchii]|uniref:hypothetical protein n=1 Tax=Devosia lacusdianchii TaxID=2917991 RepID=UPI001F059EDB|nr:hypothetical protein [Devosia sp. JXJ CY 41]